MPRLSLLNEQGEHVGRRGTSTGIVGHLTQHVNGLLTDRGVWGLQAYLDNRQQPADLLVRFAVPANECGHAANRTAGDSSRSACPTVACNRSLSIPGIVERRASTCARYSGSLSWSRLNNSSAASDPNPRMTWSS